MENAVSIDCDFRNFSNYLFSQLSETFLLRKKVENDNPFDMNRDVSSIERIYSRQLSCVCDSKHRNHVRNGRNINSFNSVRRKYCVFFRMTHRHRCYGIHIFFVRVGFFLLLLVESRYCHQHGCSPATISRQDKSTELCTQALRVNNVK